MEGSTLGTDKLPQLFKQREGFIVEVSISFQSWVGCIPLFSFFFSSIYIVNVQNYPGPNLILWSQELTRSSPQAGSPI